MRSACFDGLIGEHLRTLAYRKRLTFVKPVRDDASMTATSNTLLVSRQQAAALLGLSLRGIDYLLARGELPSRRLGKRRLIPRSAVERLSRHDLTRITPAPKAEDRQ
jgi:excisionase family DNA binding protein